MRIECERSDKASSTIEAPYTEDSVRGTTERRRPVQAAAITAPANPCSWLPMPPTFTVTVARADSRAYKKGGYPQEAQEPLRNYKAQTVEELAKGR